MSIHEVALAHIDRDRYQFRDSLGGDGWAEGVGALAASIALNGQLQPVLIVPKDARAGIKSASNAEYDLVYGHRRCEAIVANGGTHVKALVRPRPTRESDILAWIQDENGQREPFTAVENARMEARLKRQYIDEGRCSCATVKVPGRPSYGKVRAAETGESVRAIENRVALGTATQAVQHAVDVGTLGVAGGYSAARFERNVQLDIVAYLEGANLRGAGPRDVAAAVVALHPEQAVQKNGQDYFPSAETRSLADQNQALHLTNKLLKIALGWYAEPSRYAPYSGPCHNVGEANRDGGQYARDVIGLADDPQGLKERLRAQGAPDESLTV